MGHFSIRPLPDMITQHDAQMFRTLEQMAEDGHSPEELSHVLSEHMHVIDVVVCQPDDAPPDGSRLVMMPLLAESRYVADLYAVLPPSADSMVAAAQLSYFAPIIAACANYR